MAYKIINADVIDGLRSLPDQSVHCIVTSPPYFGLRDYGVEGQIGLEPTLKDYVNKLLAACRELRRVLRDDGTFWLNLGDSYSGAGPSGATYKSKTTLRREGIDDDNGFRLSKTLGERGLTYADKKPTPSPGFKSKDRIMVPSRVAIALQDDGWWLRDEIVWHKPNPMPSSVRDRTTSSHEMIYLLTKSAKYFYDTEAVKAQAVYPHDKRRPLGSKGAWEIDGRKQGENGGGRPYDHDSSKANLRSVWTIPTEPYKGAHFACFPKEIPRRCIKAGTSFYGVCEKCLAPWIRVVEKNRIATRPGLDTKVTGDGMADGNRDPERHITMTKTVGWNPTCQCNADAIPATVLDPFAGSFTTGAVAIELERDAIGIELNREYCKLGEQRCQEAELEFKTPLFEEAQPLFGD